MTGDLRTLVEAALAGVEPGRLVERALAERPLPSGGVRLLAVGKASTAMARAAAHLLGPRLVDGLAIGPVAVPGSSASDAGVRFVRGDHPMPSTASEEAGRAALAFASAPSQAGALLVLVSGGASALMVAPAPGLTLADKQRTTDRLLRAGVTIHELNTVRKHLSAVKGGRLAAVSPVPVLTLAISDVVGDDPEVIGSGPTVADPSSFADTWRVLVRTGGDATYPPAVVQHVTRGMAGDPAVPESPKPGDPRLARSMWRLVGGRRNAMQAVADAAAAMGYQPEITDEPVVGEARDAATHWLARVRAAAGQPGRRCLISSGETTVRVTGTGLGGRNQEFALATVDLLPTLGRPVALASVGTDGIDGPTDAGGAIVTDRTGQQARAAGLPPAGAFLANNDAYRFFDPLNALVRSGPTGTNVGDLQICLIA